MATRPPPRRLLSMPPSLILYEPATRSPTLALHQYPPREVAMELCLMDSQLLRNISPQELEDGAWMKADKMTRAPNIMAMVLASNTLAQLVPTEVLKEQTISAMARCLSVFIKIASKCHRLNNYNSLKAILAGLQCTPLYRLKLSWREVPTKRKRRFDCLCKLMSEERNWRVYSHQLQELLDTTTPCIPFLGVLLTTTVQYHSKLEGRSRKVSGIEDYTLLEAITVRSRLDTLSRLSTGVKSLAPWREEEGSTTILETPEIQLCILGHNSESPSSEEDPPAHTHRQRAWSELSGLDRLHNHKNEQTQSRSCQDLRDETNWEDRDWETRSSHNSLDSSSISTTESSNVATPTSVSPTVATPPTIATPTSASPTNTSPTVPMRKRSTEIMDRTNRKSRIKSSKFSIDIPPCVLRERRRPSTLLGVLHGASTPSGLLSCYQIMALGCSASMHSKPELRDIITNSHRNTEAVNYQLSHLREP